MMVARYELPGSQCLACPEGDSARGNPGNMFTQWPALKGRKIFVTGGLSGHAHRRIGPTALQGGAFLLIGTWG
jgi:hypothetical protein